MNVRDTFRRRDNPLHSQKPLNPQPLKQQLYHLQKHQPIWLSTTGWGLAHICLGILLLDFQAAPLIWILLIASSLAPFSNSWGLPLSLRTWAPALTLSLALIGIALPSWAIFMLALPMTILFVSLTLIGNQPIKASLINSLAVYGCSTLFISLVAIALGMAQGDRLTPLTACLPLGIAAITLPLCAPRLAQYSRVLQRETSWPLCFCGVIAFLGLGGGAWTIQSPWVVSLLASGVTP